MKRIAPMLAGIAMLAGCSSEPIATEHAARAETQTPRDPGVRRRRQQGPCDAAPGDRVVPPVRQSNRCWMVGQDHRMHG